MCHAFRHLRELRRLANAEFENITNLATSTAPSARYVTKIRGDITTTCAGTG